MLCSVTMLQIMHTEDRRNLTLKKFVFTKCEERLCICPDALQDELVYFFAITLW